MSYRGRANQVVRILLVASILNSATATAYEIDTHAQMTKAAFDQSIPGSDALDVIRNLGLLKTRRSSATILDRFNLSLGSKYKDLSTVPPTTRDAKPYDEANDSATRALRNTTFRWKQTEFDEIAVPYFPVDWMARGAVREDDAATLMTTLETVFGDSNAPDMLDANPKINRFCNHFYDPINNGKLELGGSPLALFACGPSEVFSTGVQWVMGASTLRFVEAHKSTRPPTGKGVFHV